MEFLFEFRSRLFLSIQLGLFSWLELPEWWSFSAEERSEIAQTLLCRTFGQTQSQTRIFQPRLGTWEKKDICQICHTYQQKNPIAYCGWKLPQAKTNSDQEESNLWLKWSQFNSVDHVGVTVGLLKPVSNTEKRKRKQIITNLHFDILYFLAHCTFGQWIPEIQSWIRRASWWVRRVTLIQLQ